MSVTFYIDHSEPSAVQISALQKAGISEFRSANALYFAGLLSRVSKTKRIIADCANHEVIAKAAKAAGYEFAKLSDLKPAEPEPEKAETVTPKAPTPKGADAIKAAEGG